MHRKNSKVKINKRVRLRRNIDGGARLPVLWCWTRRWKTTACVAGPVRRQTYGYLHSLCQYQFMLPGNRGAYVNNLPRTKHESAAAGVVPDLPLRHSATPK